MTQSFVSRYSNPATGLLDSSGRAIKTVSPFEAHSNEIIILKAMILARKKHLITKFKSPRKKILSMSQQLELSDMLITDRHIRSAEKEIQKIITKMVNTKYAVLTENEILNGRSKLEGIPKGLL